MTKPRGARLSGALLCHSPGDPGRALRGAGRDAPGKPLFADDALELQTSAREGEAVAPLITLHRLQVVADLPRCPIDPALSRNPAIARMDVNVVDADACRRRI